MGAEAVKPAAETWWDWLNPDSKSESLSDDATDAAKTSFFDNLVQRCVLVDSLSPSVTVAVLDRAVAQFGTVKAVKFLKSPLLKQQPFGCGIVEMADAEQAKTVEAQFREYMMMVGGMPRPARVRRSTAAMLLDHPFARRKFPIELKMVSKKDPEANRLFRKRRKFEEHCSIASLLQKSQRKAEEDLSNKQEENFRELKRKYSSIKDNKELAELRRAYNIPYRD